MSKHYEYKIDDIDACLTKCPHKKGFWMGSTNCIDCSHYDHRGSTHGEYWISCNYTSYNIPDNIVNISSII